MLKHHYKCNLKLTKAVKIKVSADHWQFWLYTWWLTHMRSYFFHHTTKQTSSTSPSQLLRYHQ